MDFAPACSKTGRPSRRTGSRTMQQMSIAVRRARSARSITTATVLAAALAAATTLPAQTTVVQGRVMDALTFEPVSGAFVAQIGSDLGVLTDSLGLFTLELSAAYRPMVRIWQMGYRPVEADASGASPGRLLTVALAPDPVQLEGLTVLAERLAERRRGPYGVADVLDRDALIKAPEGSSFELVTRMLPFARVCDTQQSEALCMGMRDALGMEQRVKVCLDGSLVPQDYTQTILETVNPRSLYLVEVYPRVGEVRLYTPGYVQQLLDLGEDLPPLTFGCQGPPEGIIGR